MSDTIHIGKTEIALADYAVGASAVLGIRDSGKTVTAKGIAEQLLENKIPIIVFDAVGKWRWMKVAAEGSRGKAYKIVVAGGRGPDLPLTPHSVPEIVRSALKERIPLIIDLFSRELSKADWRKIVQTAIHIIHYENEGGAVHVFLEEAAEFVPQKIYDGETYAEVEKLVRMGGNASVGITLINQRSQEVNKAVLDNCSTALVLGCQVGKNAIEAVEKWIERLDPKTAEELTASLPKLQSGEAWVWTRKSLDRPTRERMPMCRSFHPDRRTSEFVLKSVKPTDTDEFVKRLSDAIPKVIAETKSNDPAELKRQVAILKKELSKKPAAEPERVEVPVLKNGQLDKANLLIDRLNKLAANITDAAKFLADSIGKVTKPAMRPTSQIQPRIQPIRQRERPAITDEDLTGPEQRILDAIAWLESIGVDTPEETAVAFLAGYTIGGGAFNNPRGRLRGKGLIDYVGSGCLRLTDEGRTKANVPNSPLTTEELHRAIMDRLPGPENRILQPLIDAFPNDMSNEELAEASGYEVHGGAYNNPRGRLRSLGLIEYRGGRVVARSILFLQNK